MKKQRFILTILLLAIAVCSYAQHSDSLAIKPTDSVPLPLYPRVRLLSVTYDQAATTKYKVSNTGHADNGGEITRGRLQLFGMLPLWKKGSFTLSVTELFTREHQNIRELENPLYTDTRKEYDFDNFITGLNGTYVTKLFNRPFIANASIVAGSANFVNIEKVTGLVTGVFVFQKSPVTRYSLGLAAIVDPSSQIPAFPVITYWHRFKDPRWEIDIILPSMVKLVRSGVFGGWLSAGTEFNAFGYFIHDVPGQTKTFLNSYSELSFQASYERIFFKNYMFSVQGGYRANLQNRILGVYEQYDNSNIKINVKGAPFFKLGLSYIIPNNKVKKEVMKNLEKDKNINNLLLDN